MSFLEKAPATTARSLCSTIDALRGETGMLRATGALAIDVDDLLDGGGAVQRWLADLATAAAMSDQRHLDLPDRDPGVLQQVVYSISAVLVWAHELWLDGRIATTVPMEALHAWDLVERAAGLGGRTAAAIGAPTTGPMRVAASHARGDERFAALTREPVTREPITREPVSRELRPQLARPVAVA